MAAAAERSKANDGQARTRAREIAEREVAAQREQQAQQHRIDVLNNFASARFKRLNRTLTLSVSFLDFRRRLHSCGTRDRGAGKARRAV
jgi:hypothetical protein